MGKTFGVAMLVAALVAFSCVPSGAQEMVEDTVSGQVQAAQADLALYQEHLFRAQRPARAWKASWRWLGTSATSRARKPPRLRLRRMITAKPVF